MASKKRKRLTVDDVRDMLEEFLEFAEKGNVKQAKAAESALHKRVLRALADDFFKGSAVEIAKVADKTTRFVLE